MKAALQALLENLDAISKAHEEINDTDVREQLFDAVYHAFILQTADFTVPEDFGMFEPEANTSIRRALTEFVWAASASGPATPEQRFSAFQDTSVVSSAGSMYDTYFGHSESFAQVSAAVQKLQLPPPAASRKAWWQFWKP